MDEQRTVLLSEETVKYYCSVCKRLSGNNIEKQLTNPK
jgi:hypothetical protein